MPVGWLPLSPPSLARVGVAPAEALAEASRAEASRAAPQAVAAGLGGLVPAGRARRALVLGVARGRRGPRVARQHPRRGTLPPRRPAAKLVAPGTRAAPDGLRARPPSRRAHGPAQAARAAPLGPPDPAGRHTERWLVLRYAGRLTQPDGIPERGEPDRYAVVHRWFDGRRAWGVAWPVLASLTHRNRSDQGSGATGGTT